ncbi:MAG: hypothetical protein C0483_08580 [Pirellula sp.]|nr:hypothetical protein [Pirellula sp.]
MSKKTTVKKPKKKAAKKAALIDVSDVVDTTDWVLTYTHQKCTLEDVRDALKNWSAEVRTLIRRCGEETPLEQLTWDGEYRNRYED